MQAHQLEVLLQKYGNRTLSASERSELLAWLEQKGDVAEEAVIQLLQQQQAAGEVVLPENWMQDVQQIVAADRVQIAEGTDTWQINAEGNRIEVGATANRVQVKEEANRLPTEEADKQPTPVVRMRNKWWYAAAGILLITAGAIAYQQYAKKPAEVVRVAPAPAMDHDATPGKNGAVLTLADGSHVVLDSLGNGMVAKQNGAQVVLEDGALNYHPDKAGEETIVFNTMSTPRGRQFKMTLPDGTLVWLNAASSIRFPTKFIGISRTVELTGEAYFEVAKNAAQPFMVNLGDQKSIEVVGTHFNVKAYEEDHEIRTTLLEGSVKVYKGTFEASLKPGEQLSIPATGKMKWYRQADTEQATAWMNRSFSFKNDELEVILKQLARWYDIEVKYDGAIPKKKFSSNLSMDNNLSDFLTILASSGIKYSLENGVLRIR